MSVSAKSICPATSVAGAREHAVPFATLDHALQISTRLAEMQARGPGGRGARAARLCVPLLRERRYPDPPPRGKRS